MLAPGQVIHQVLVVLDYLLIGPQAFLEAAEPLLELRRSQGLQSMAVAMEEVYSEFGFGETPLWRYGIFWPMPTTLG